MNKSDVLKFVKGVQNGISKRSPEILTGLGIAGMITTTVLAVKATPKALRLIDKAETRGAGIVSKDGSPDWEARALTKREIIKVAWKPYIPAIVTGMVSTGCLIGASSVSARRNAALATAYQLSTTALSEYKEKVVETIGEKKEQAIKDKIAQDHVENNPVTKSEVFITKKGNTLIYDKISGRYFEHDIDQIRKIVNELNRQMTVGVEPYISLNEFYAELGISGIGVGNEIGWNISDSLIEVTFSATMTDDEQPCLCMDYMVEPRYDYRKLY